jgi:NADH-quinone oxidoreductase subunit C
MSEENKRENEAAEAAEKHAAETPETASTGNMEAVKAETAQTAKPEAAAPETAKTEKTAEEKPAEATTEEAKPAEAESAQSKPAEPKAAEAKPAAEKTEGAKPAPAQAAAEGEAAPVRRKETEEEKAARRKAALEAREAAKAAAAHARAAGAAAPAAGKTGEAQAAEAAPKPPSPNQPRLDRAAAIIRSQVAEDAVEEAYINELNGDLPTLVIKRDHWLETARLFRDHEELGCAYLRNITGVDYETYMEVVYFPLNMQKHEMYCVKVRTDREQPSVPSVTPIWETANWNEREIFDLLGIDFPGHPKLTRIMLPDDWVGHPLRKDYVPLDPEV